MLNSVTKFNVNILFKKSLFFILEILEKNLFNFIYILYIFLIKFYNNKGQTCYEGYIYKASVNIL